MTHRGMTLKPFLGLCAILFGLVAVIDAVVREQIEEPFSDLRLMVRDETRAAVLTFVPPPDPEGTVDGV